MMDQRIADELARGRVQFRAGKLTVAITTWKEALRVAYETQNQSAAFALSKSLGDAVLESSRRDVDGLLEAVGYYEYALQLLDACDLRDEYAFYPPLESVVQYIHRRRRRAQCLIRNLEAPEDEIQDVTPHEELTTTASGHDREVAVAAVSELCSTCEKSGSTVNPIVVDEADGCFYCQSCFDAYYADANGVQPPTVEDAGDSLVDEEASPMKTVSLHETSVDEATEAESPHIDSPADSSGQPGTTIDGEPTEEAIDPTAVEATGFDGTSEYALAEEEDNGQPEPTSVSSTKLQYSIANLKSLRPHDLPCPSALKHSPVALSNATPPSTHSRNQKSTSRKDKPAQRSAKAHSASVNQEPHAAAAEEKLTSFLPSLVECKALRATMTTLPSPLELAQAFFDAPDTTPASSFTTQLQVFSNTA